MKLLHNELTTAWTNNNLSYAEIEDEIRKIEDQIQKNNIDKLDKKQLLEFEETHLLETDKILSLPKDEFLRVKFQCNPYVSVFTSRYTYTAHSTEKSIALIPKCIAFAEPKVLPLYLMYERRFFTQFMTLPPVFSGSDLVEKSSVRNGRDQRPYWEDFYEYMLKRFLSVFLVTPFKSVK